MTTFLQLQLITVGDQAIELYVPDPIQVKHTYQQQLSQNGETAFPYWTKIWPAAIALTQFILQNTAYVHNKNVLELAAGLGLPSITAAKFASKVCCSDHEPGAVTAMQRSVIHNKLINVNCIQLNWELLTTSLEADVLLLSDINYDPKAFDKLHKMLLYFIEKGSTILLSTPQRLSSKPFIQSLLPWCIQQQEIEVETQQQKIMVSILVLKKSKDRV